MRDTLDEAELHENLPAFDEALIRLLATDLLATERVLLRYFDSPAIPDGPQVFGISPRPVAGGLMPAPGSAVRSNAKGGL
jgi:hypothetical protein